VNNQQLPASTALPTGFLFLNYPHAPCGHRRGRIMGRAPGTQHHRRTEDQAGDQGAGVARETAGKLGLGTSILDASGFGDTKHHETGQVADSIDKSDGFAQVFLGHRFHIVNVLQERGH